MARVAGLGLAEGAGVVDRASRAVGHPAHVVVEHLVVDDTLQEVARHLGPVQHRVDADEREHRVVAAEGEPATPGAAHPAPPGDRNPHVPPKKRRLMSAYTAVRSWACPSVTSGGIVRGVRRTRWRLAFMKRRTSPSAARPRR